jgi:hypothetical protein
MDFVLVEPHAIQPADAEHESEHHNENQCGNFLCSSHFRWHPSFTSFSSISLARLSVNSEIGAFHSLSATKRNHGSLA